MNRRCGDCSLCCRLLPMQAGSFAREHAQEAIALGLAKPGIKEFDKPAGKRCPHQRHGKGCTIYARRPLSCQIWNCRWLVDRETLDLRRPDRAGYVVDMMPDFTTLDDGEGGRTNVQVVQIWVDPSRPNAWREDEALRAYLDRLGYASIAALIRFDAHDALALFPPAMSSDGQWHEVRGKREPQHKGSALRGGLAECRNVKLEIP